MKLLDRETGSLFTGQCGKASCPICIIPRALNIAHALALAAPEYFLRLSLVGRDHQDIRTRMKGFTRRLRTSGRQFAYAASVEPNPNGTGNHSHLWIHGTPLDPSDVQDAAVMAGMGTDIWLEAARVPNGPDPKLTYGLKMVLDEERHSTEEMPPAAKVYLELNGGRLVASSRDFWRDGRNREPLGGRREAERLARRRAGLHKRYLVAGAV
ncbi:hypothetical protein ACT8ZV_02380 [Nocardioides sp. MAHUQ-72]